MITQHHASVTLYRPDESVIATFSVKPGSSLTLDETRSPFAAARLTVPLPPTTVRTALDPRGQLVRADVELSRSFTGTLPIAALSGRYAARPVAAVSSDFPGRSIADVSASLVAYWNGQPSPPPETLRVSLFLLDTEANYAADELQLVLVGAEILMQQDVNSGQAPYFPGAIDLGTIVTHVIESLGYGYVFSQSGEPVTVEAEASEWKVGVSGWDYLRPMVEAAGRRLWADVQGFWHLEPAITSRSISDWSTQNTTELRDKTSRAGTWADAVLVIYEWEDANGDEQRRVDYAKAVENPTKPRVFRRSTPWPGAGAARSLLTYVRTRGRDVEVSAVSDYTVEPGGLALVRVPGVTFALRKTVAAVEYSLGSDEMTLTLRDQLAEGETD